MPTGTPKSKEVVKEVTEQTVNIRIKRMNYGGKERCATTGFFLEPDHVPNEWRNGDGKAQKRKMGVDDVVTLPQSIANQYLATGSIEIC